MFFYSFVLCLYGYFYRGFKLKIDRMDGRLNAYGLRKLLAILAQKHISDWLQQPACTQLLNKTIG